MKCSRCNREFLHGDKVYDNLFMSYCEDCIVEVLIELVQDDIERAANKFKFDMCKYNGRDDELYPWGMKL